MFITFKLLWDNFLCPQGILKHCKAENNEISHVIMWVLGTMGIRQVRSADRQESEQVQSRTYEVHTLARYGKERQGIVYRQLPSAMS